MKFPSDMYTASIYQVPKSSFAILLADFLHNASHPTYIALYLKY